MNGEKLLDAVGMVNEEAVQDAALSGRTRCPAWRRWAAAAACLLLVLSTGVYLTNLLGARGGPGWEDPLRPDGAIAFNGAYYQLLDMTDTGTLDRLGLPREITPDLLGENLGPGQDEEGERTGDLYQYAPYARIRTADGQTCRAVYIVEEEGTYAYAAFIRFARFDGNTHQELTELLAVYGVDEAADLESVTIGDSAAVTGEELSRLYEEALRWPAMGRDDFLRTEGNAGEAVPVELRTAAGVVADGLLWYPELRVLAWGLSYYQAGGDPLF